MYDWVHLERGLTKLLTISGKSMGSVLKCCHNWLPANIDLRTSICAMVAPPLILLIVTDQFRHDSWGASPTNPSNNLTPDTPNLDSLAKNGYSFKNAFASTPTCTPSRASLLTGRSPWGKCLISNCFNYNCSIYVIDVFVC